MSADGNWKITISTPMGPQTVEAAITTPMPMTLEFVATVEGDNMKGNVKLGSFGNAGLTGVRA